MSTRTQKLYSTKICCDCDIFGPRSHAIVFGQNILQIEEKIKTMNWQCFYMNHYFQIFHWYKCWKCPSTSSSIFWMLFHQPAACQQAQTNCQICAEADLSKQVIVHLRTVCLKSIQSMTMQFRARCIKLHCRSTCVNETKMLKQIIVHWSKSSYGWQCTEAAVEGKVWNQ